MRELEEVIQDQEIEYYEDLMLDVISWITKVWKHGEGDILIEIRNDGGVKKAKRSYKVVKR